MLSSNKENYFYFGHMDNHHLRFPIGEFKAPASYDEASRQKCIRIIANFPQKVRELSESANSQQLRSKYRPDGWTFSQVVHHCADSHMQSITRFKLALTEENPTIRPYLEDKWAELSDGDEFDLSPSIKMLEGIHTRWVHVLNNMSNADFDRTFYHPEMQRSVSLNESLEIYAWHCQHHYAHLELAIESNGKNN